MVNQLDFFPTILKLTKTPFNKEDAKKLDGLDISAVLHGESDKVIDKKGKERESLFWHFPHNDNAMKATIRKGDFKLYRHFVNNTYSMYRLYEDGNRADLEERHNIIKEENILL